jgi:hypothetical protein
MKNASACTDAFFYVSIKHRFVAPVTYNISVPTVGDAQRNNKNTAGDDKDGH